MRNHRPDSNLPNRPNDRRRPGAHSRARLRVRRAGFLELDILAGLFIVAALTLSLAAVLGRQHRAVQKLADSRAAMQVAETVLTDLQAGRAGPGGAPQPGGGGPDTSVEVRPAGDGANAANAADAHSGTWVEVVVTVRGGHASLVGPVPSAAAASATGGGR
jgi:hypothetical protein